MIRTALIPLSCTLLLAISGCDDGNDREADPRDDDVMPCVTDCPGDDDSAGDKGDDDGDHEEDTDCDDEDTDGDTDTDGDDEDTDDDEGEADLPYALEVDLGDIVDLNDAFLEEGPLPAAVLEITMEDGGDWRLDEFRLGIPFIVTEEDCEHEGNRDTGRDRLFVTWQNDDGSEDTDHIDIRYCGA